MSRNIPYTLEEVKPLVYLLKFEHGYDPAMSFIRAQEYQESPHYQGVCFKLHEFMHWYAFNQSKTNDFSYATDYVGFNVTGAIVGKVMRRLMNTRFDVITAHDKLMYKVYKKLYTKHKDNFYLIGVSNHQRKVAFSVLEHEIGHGMYNTIPAYKKAMDEHIEALPSNIYKKMCAVLDKVGYHPCVYRDETQAYMSTGLRKDVKFEDRDMTLIKNIEKYIEPFKQTFNKYYKGEE